MTIEQSKEKLQKEGYTYFELSEFDKDFYNFLLPVKCDENNSLKERLTFLRADINNKKTGEAIYKINTDFGSFYKAEEKKNELLSLKELSERDILGGNTDDALYINQIWYFTDLNVFLEKSNLTIEQYQKYIKKIIKYFFDINDNQDYRFLSTATLYDNECLLKNHSDGIQKNRICAILIYLNDNYNENDGGCLILNDNEVVVPTFGKVAIIDLQNFDIPHMVNKVIGGNGRYTLLSFINKI